MIFRRCGQGVKLPDVSEFIADIFKPTDAGHQLAAAYRRVSDRAVKFFNQADTVAVFVFEIQTFEKFTSAALLFTPVSHAVFTRIGMLFLTDVTDSNLQMFAPCSRNATQTTTPPHIVKHASDGRGDFIFSDIFLCHSLPMRRGNIELQRNKTGAHVPGVQRFKLAKSGVINVSQFSTNEISDISSQ